MIANPILGVIFHAIGGLASGSFYIPYKRVRYWAWETYWLAGGFFSWIIAPWVLALIIVPDVPQIILSTDKSTLFWCYFWGAMWGIGGLTFGLTMRYLGIALGMAIALGYCAAFGTLMKPLYAHFQGKPDLMNLFTTIPGLWVLGGVAICLLGIAISGLAGMSKEKELSEEQKKETIEEFNFFKGILVATFSGIMSSSMSYGITAGEPMSKIALEHNAPVLFQSLPTLIVVLAGGFTSNFIWCALLSRKNKSASNYIAPIIADPENPTQQIHVPLFSNYLFSAIAGTTWYLQFFFYSMGETQMGHYKFSSWTLHMSSIIIFSTLWGIILHEWKGTSKRTHVLIAAGLAVLISSLILVGYGNWLALQ